MQACKRWLPAARFYTNRRFIISTTEEKRNKLSAASSFKKDTFKKTDTYNLLHAFVNSSRRATHNIQNCTKSGVTPAASEHYDS